MLNMKQINNKSKILILESFQTIYFGKMIQQSLDMRWHGRCLGHMASSCVESGLVCMILNLHLFAFRSHKTVTAMDSIWCSNLLSGGTIIIGKTKIWNSIVYKCRKRQRV